MLAASAASALPRANTSAKCATVPAPPEAITGIRTASLTAAVNSQSKPARVPSESIEVRRISPAPRCSASRAHSTTVRPIGRRPPCTYTCASRTGSAAARSRRASMATTTACAPKLRANCADECGVGQRGGIDADLVRACLEYLLGVVADLIPPPTQNGTKSSRAVRRTVSSSVWRPSCVAVMSSRTISSAPSRA